MMRLTPGSDLRQDLTRIAREQRLDAAFVLSAVGSLDVVVLRYAGEVVLGIADGCVFKRQFDPETGFRELVPHRKREAAP